MSCPGSSQLLALTSSSPHCHHPHGAIGVRLALSRLFRGADRRACDGRSEAHCRLLDVIQAFRSYFGYGAGGYSRTGPVNVVFAVASVNIPVSSAWCDLNTFPARELLCRGCGGSRNSRLGVGFKHLLRRLADIPGSAVTIGFPCY